MQKNKIMEMQASQKLSPLQLELLKVYSFNPTEEELLQIKEILARFFAKRFTDRVAQAAEAKGITDDDLDRWLNETNQ
ncbi:MAG: hypothetical protein KIS77_11935 [Saprospiraceae bacterium]|nr:hypothetical protein [Saprospiraceae bacterium]